MNIQKLDIFSSTFQFNFGIQNQRKGSIYGAILSIFLIIVILIYSSYLFYLYFTDQINPNYASQSFISEDTINIDLSNDLFGFRYEYGVNLNLDDLQDQQNKTYLVFVPLFYYQNGSDFEVITLNYTKCSSPKLKGFNCLDFSNVKNQSLILSTLDNISSNIFLFVYQCQDTDVFKTFIPKNCAEQTEINSVMNNPYADLRLKLYTSQYNTTSQQQQSSYRNEYVYLQGDEFQLYTFKTQKQITKLKKGAIIQSESEFSSPISYDLQNFSFNRQSFMQNANQTSYLQINIEMDEIVQIIQIQYSTFPQILAQCNSTLAFLMCLGFLGRNFAQRLMRQDIFLLMLQNMFLGTYQNIIKESKILDKNEEDYQSQNKSEQNQIQEREEEIQQECIQQVFVPSFDTKLIKSIDNNYMLSPKSQGESLLINSPKSQNNRFIQYELAEQKLQATKKKTMKSMFNQQISLNSEQKRKQRKIKLANSRLLKQNSFQNSNQIQNTYENITQKSQETQETLFKGLGKQDHFKKSQSIYSEGKQQDKDGISQIINTEKLKTTYEYYLKKTKVIQSKSVMKDIQNKIFKMKFFRVSDYQKSQGLDKLDKKAIDNHINQSLDIQQLYRDIIFLKKAASILLTKDQLAIIQLIGLSSEYLKQSGKMSYFEEQYSILNNNELQEKYISLFFKRVIDNEQTTETDLRILDSLL